MKINICVPYAGITRIRLVMVGVIEYSLSACKQAPIFSDYVCADNYMLLSSMCHSVRYAVE